MTARVASTGPVRQLDRRAEPDTVVTEGDVKDAAKLARTLNTILKAVARLARSFAPKRIDFEDVSVDSTGTTKYRFDHGFGGRVRWWVIDIRNDTTYVDLRHHADTDANTLVLTSYADNIVTIRLEAAG